MTDRHTLVVTLTAVAVAALTYGPLGAAALPRPSRSASPRAGSDAARTEGATVMMLISGLLAAALVTWRTRVSFIALVPPERLPADLPQIPGAATPAVFGALAVVTVLRSDVAATTGVASMVPPLAVAALLAHRRLNLAVVVLAAIATAAGLRFLGW